jgi:hypothetical protein
VSTDYEGERITAEVRELAAEVVAALKQRKAMDREHELCLQEGERNNRKRESITQQLDGLRKRLALGTLTASDATLGELLVTEYEVLHAKEQRLLSYLESVLLEHRQRCAHIREIRKQMEALMEEAIQKGCEVDFNFPELE